jgi:hypothetical protein
MSYAPCLTVLNRPRSFTCTSCNLHYSALEREELLNILSQIAGLLFSTANCQALPFKHEHNVCILLDDLDLLRASLAAELRDTRHTGLNRLACKVACTETQLYRTGYVLCPHAKFNEVTLQQCMLLVQTIQPATNRHSSKPCKETSQTRLKQLSAPSFDFCHFDSFLCRC